MRLYMRAYQASCSHDLTDKLQEFNKRKWGLTSDIESKSIIARNKISRLEQIVSVIGYAILNFFTLGRSEKLKGELRDRIKKEEAVQIQLKPGCDLTVQAILDKFLSKSKSKSGESSGKSSQTGSSVGTSEAKPVKTEGCKQESIPSAPVVLKPINSTGQLELASKITSKEQVASLLQKGDRESLHTLYSCMVDANFDQWDAFEPADIEKIDFTAVMAMARKQVGDFQSLIIDHLFGYPVISERQQNRLQKVSGNNLKAIKDQLRIMHLKVMTESQEKERIKFEVYEGLEKGEQEFLSNVAFYMVLPNFDQWDLIKPTHVKKLQFVELMQRAEMDFTEKSVIHHLFGDSEISAEQQARLQVVCGANLQAIYPHLRDMHFGALTEAQREEIEKFKEESR